MDSETKARIFEEGGKLASGLLSALLTRPRKTTSPESGKLAPEKEDISKVSHEPEEAPEIASVDEVIGGTAGSLCGDEHLSQAAGDLDEALRMARSRGIKDSEVRERLKGARSELNQMERYDLMPTKIKTYPKEQQEIARWLLPKSSSLRHQINDILLRDREIEDLENLTANADTVSSELTDRIDKLPKEQRETDACIIYTERAKPVSKTGLPPEIEALKEMVEERKQETMFFNVPEAREQLISKGFVYTLRPKMRKTGKDTAFTGRWFEKEKIGHIWVDFIKEVKDIGEVEQYLPDSGFEKLTDWWQAAKGSRFLFKVKLL